MTNPTPAPAAPLDIEDVKRHLVRLKAEVRSPFEAMMYPYTDPRSTIHPNYYDRMELVATINPVIADVSALVVEVERLRANLERRTVYIEQLLKDLDYADIPGRALDEAKYKEILRHD